MKGFWALPVLLRVAVASKRAFSVNDDVLAFPQYEIKYADTHVTEDRAAALLRGDQHATNDLSHSTGLQKQDPDATWSHPEDASAQEPVTYETLWKHGRKYLCGIPFVAPESKDDANATKSKQQERAELEQARLHGWELLGHMQNRCLYFRDGWWTYQYCYGQGVKQFHSLPSQPGVAPIPPREDPNAQKFMLGEVSDKAAEMTGESRDLDVAKSDQTAQTPSYGALETRGGVNYLVQKLDGGTLCDLTGKPRKVEVQFHCGQVHDDHIETIKEIATCTYLMVIKTPKLCDDVAFLSPQVDDPNYITCAPVLGQDEDPSHLPHPDRKPHAELPNPFQSPPLPRVGTWSVGAHSLIPADRPLARSGILRGTTKSRNSGGTKAVLSSDGAVHDSAALKAAGVTSEAQLAQLREKMEARAKGKPWRLEVEDGALTGVVGEDDPPAEKAKDAPAKKPAAEKAATEPQPNEGSAEEYFPSDPEVAPKKAEKKPTDEETDDEDKRIRALGKELVEALMRREQVGEGEPLLFWDDGAGEIAFDPELLEGILNAALPQHDEL